MVKAIRNRGLAIVLAAVTAMASLGMTSTISHAETASGALEISTQTAFTEWIGGTDYKDANSTVTLKGNFTASATVTEFAGTLNGGSHTITLDLDTSTGNTAFIGTLDSTGKVKDVNFAGSVKSSTTGDYVAAAVALNKGLVDKVTNTATVEATSAYNVGGIVGYNDNYNSSTVGVVQNSQNKAAVSGKSKTGGIVGENAGTVSSCSNTAAIRSYGGGKDGTGGIVGRNGNNNTAVETGVVRNCYNTGAITDKSAAGSTGRWVGGITGFQNSLSSTVNSYSTGDVSGYRNYNNIVGSNEGTTTNCYTDATRGTGSTIDETGTVLEEDDTLSAATLEGTTTPTYWSDVDGAKFPELTYKANETNESVSVDPTTATDFYVGGTNASDSATGLASDASVATLAKAVDLAGASTASAKTIHVLGTVDVADSERVFAGSGITAKWEGSADTMFNVTGSLVLGGLTVDGNSVATMFNVATGGSVALRNNAVLSGAATVFDVKTGGSLTLNRSSVTGTSYAVKLADSTSACTMSVASGQEIALSGNVYLGTGATMTMAANPATMLTKESTITVECEAFDALESSVIAAVPGTDVTFTSDDVLKIQSASELYTQSLDNGNIAFVLNLV